MDQRRGKSKIKRAVANDGPTERMSGEMVGDFDPDDADTEHMLEDSSYRPLANDGPTERMLDDGPTDRLNQEGSGEHHLHDDLADTTIRTDRVFGLDSDEDGHDPVAETTTLPRRYRSTSDVLTEDDFDDYAPTIEQRAPPVEERSVEQALPPARPELESSEDTTATFELRRDLADRPDPVTMRQASVEDEESAPRPIHARRSPVPYSPPPPPPPPKKPSLPPPRTARAAPPPPPRKPSLPPPAPPPRKASLPPIAPPPKKPSLPPPAPLPRVNSPRGPETMRGPERYPQPFAVSRRPPPKPPRPLQAPPVDPYVEPVPRTRDRNKRRSSRPAPPSYGYNAPASENTRPFPLMAPQSSPFHEPYSEAPSIEIPTTRAGAYAAYVIATPPPAYSGPTTDMPIAPAPMLAPALMAAPAPEPPPQLPYLHSAPPPQYVPSTPPAIAQEPLPALPALPRRRRRTQSEKTALAATIGVFGALIMAALIGTVVYTAFRSNEESEAPIPPPTGTPVPGGDKNPQPIKASTPGVPMPALAGCSLAVRAGKIATSAIPTVLPMAAPAPGILRAAVGFASAKNHAEGVVVKLENLQVEPRYSEEFNRPIQRVTPLTDRAPVTFAVDQEDPKIHLVRTIPARPPFRIGTSYAGFVRMNDPGEPSVIWPGSRIEGIGDPSFAITERDGYGVAFRTGRNSGDIFVGWLTPSGTADGDLERIDAGPREVGPAAIAASESGVLVAFAARGANEPWRIRVALAPRAKVPKTSRPIDASSLNASDTISPAVVALPQGGWLIQWLEGRPGARRVLARAFNDKLEPVGLPVEIASESGIQDTPGSLVVRENRVLSVHYAGTEKATEVWAAVLRCG